MRTDIATRFWKKLDRSGECWLWTGCKQDGYGMTTFNGRPIRAHRLAYMLTYGPIPPGAMLLHSCDVRACARPEHLRPGNHAENGRDARERGRMARGERCHNAKLTADDIKLMRASDLQDAYFARLFGVSAGTILEARRGINWASVPNRPQIPVRDRLTRESLARRPALRHPSFSPEAVHLIRASDLPNRYFARLFKVHPTAIHWVRRGVSV